MKEKKMTSEEFLEKYQQRDGVVNLDRLKNADFLPDDLQMDGSLWLDGLTSIPDGFNPTVGGSLGLRGLTSIPDGFNPTVGGSLWLDGLTSIPDGFNPTVGGYLGLRGLTSIPDGFNPTVGGDLWLDGLTSIPDGFNPTVGGSLWLRGLTSKYTRLKNGMYVQNNYLYADGILTHVKRKRKFGEYTYYIGKIPGKNVIFDGKNYAHCKSFKDGVADLEFKKAKNRGASQYNDLTLDSVVTYEQAKTMYRIITGACQQGTDRFIASLDQKQIKDKYTVHELIELTKGQYRANVFEAFFKKEK